MKHIEEKIPCPRDLRKKLPSLKDILAGVGALTVIILMMAVSIILIVNPDALLNWKVMTPVITGAICFIAGLAFCWYWKNFRDNSVKECHNTVIVTVSKNHKEADPMSSASIYTPEVTDDSDDDCVNSYAPENTDDSAEDYVSPYAPDTTDDSADSAVAEDIPYDSIDAFVIVLSHRN